MAIVFRSISGLSNARIAAGMSASEVPGDGGGGPFAFVLTLSATGLAPGTGVIEILAPTTILKSASGADGAGNLSVSTTWVNSGDDIHFNQSGGGTGAFPAGFWGTAGLIRGTLSLPSNEIGIDLQIATSDVITYNQDLSVTPSAPTNPDPPNWNGDQGDVTLDFVYHDTGDDPDSLAILRDGVVVASIPLVLGQDDYSYTDIVFAAGTYEYTVMAYKYPDSRSAITDPLSVDFGGVPAVELVMSGGYTFGGSFVFNFLVDPSGIYKLVPDSTHDVLWNRADPLDIVTEDVAIPTPIIKTFFAGK